MEHEDKYDKDIYFDEEVLIEEIDEEEDQYIHDHIINNHNYDG